MSQIINLRAAKKAKDRALARAQGDANAAKFGRTKSEKAADTSRAEKARTLLDAHKRDEPAREVT